MAINSLLVAHGSSLYEIRWNANPDLAEQQEYRHPVVFVSYYHFGHGLVLHLCVGLFQRVLRLHAEFSYKPYKGGDCC